METNAEDVYRINNQTMSVNSGSKNRYNQVGAPATGDDKTVLDSSRSAVARTIRSQCGVRSNDPNRTGSFTMSYRNTTKANVTKS